MEMDTNVAKVKDFYNLYNERFVKIYGNTIQAFRTNNIEDYLLYTSNSIGFKPNEKVLDAGCGICGPAAFFANKVPNLKIEACTISEVQLAKGKNYLKENKVEKNVSVNLIDFNKLDQYFEAESFDRIYFLESFGHSHDQHTLIDTCWRLLKEEGTLYIKDLFRREFEDEWKQLRVDEIIESINRAYMYDVPNLNNLLSSMRKTGFLIEFIRMPDIDKNEFERLSISNEFQELFGGDKIESWKNYIFPIDFFEVKVTKPEITKFQQHLYHLNK